MNYEEAKLQVLEKIQLSEKLIPVELDQDLPINEFGFPKWHDYEDKIWKLGEEIRQIFMVHEKLKKDKDIKNKILDICLNRKSKRGRQSFIMLLGNVNCADFSDELMTQIDDEFVNGHVISSIYKMRASNYADTIKPFCANERSWIRNIAKKYVAKYAS